MVSQALTDRIRDKLDEAIDQAMSADCWLSQDDPDAAADAGLLARGAFLDACALLQEIRP